MARPSLVLLACAAGAAAAPALAAKGRVVRVEVEPAKIVEVPGGTFQMGLTPDDLDAAQLACAALHGQQGHTAIAICQLHQRMNLEMLVRDVHVSAFAIDRLEVTVAEYRACLRAGACPIDPLLAGDERHVADDDLPIVNVTWTEARQLCAWKDGRLPTEAEWEKAARGDDGRRWPWGDIDRDDDWNHGKMPSAAMVAVDELGSRSSRQRFAEWGDPDDRDGHAYAAPPGSFAFGDSPHGTLDQAGNVAEWVVDEWSADGYLGLPGADPVRNPDGTGDLARVVRGGSWRDAPIYGWTSMRQPINVEIEGSDRMPQVGFRCAYDR